MAQMKSIRQIFLEHDTDKNAQFHNYSRQYDRLLSNYRGQRIQYLEIGVLGGASLRAMREVFSSAGLILGLDIDPNAQQSEERARNIRVEIGDATNRAFIDNITAQYGHFDVIVDDGSHRNVDMIQSFEMLFPLLRDNGVYIVEDTVCYKSPSHNVAGFPDILSYFSKYVGYLNQWRFDSDTGIKDHCVDPFKIEKKTVDVFESSIDKIEYGVSYVAIHKKVRKHWVSG